MVESPGFATGYAIERILESRSENIKLKNKNSLLFLCSVFFLITRGYSTVGTVGIGITLI